MLLCRSMPASRAVDPDLRSRGPARRLAGRLTGALCLFLFTACGAEETGAPADWIATRDTVGDTIIVRTEIGSAWGASRLVEELRIGRLEGPDEYTFGQVAAIATGSDGTLYVLDRQPPSLRAYSPDGTFLGQLAGEGEGPGELKQPDSGLAVLPDGRILARDPGSARITVFGADGEYETEWRIRGSSYTSTPLYLDRAGNTYVQLFEFLEAELKFSFVRYGPDGEPADTIQVPRIEDAPQLTAVHESEGGTSRSTNDVPFWPVLSTTLSPGGEMVVGHPDTYSIDVPVGGRTLRIQRVFEPVPVLSGERKNRRERAIHNMRQTEPGWDWDGPPIPDTKPAFRDLMFDTDGRLWTRLYARAEPIPDAEIDEPDPDEQDPAPPQRWREPAEFDVFDTDGTYLGRVAGPKGFSWYPRPAISGDRMWGVVRDDLDIPYLVRFRIEVEAERP